MSELKLTLKQDEIRGFSYSFTRELVNKLETLYQEDALFEKGNDCSSNKDNAYSYTKLGIVITAYLTEQLQQIFPPNTYGVESMIQTGNDFLAIFETEVAVVKNSDNLEQNLHQFLLQKFDRSSYPGGERKRAFNTLMCLGDKATIKELLEIPNPLKDKDIRNRWYNWGKKSFEWTKKEFTRLGFDVEKYPFFK